MGRRFNNEDKGTDRVLSSSVCYSPLSLTLCWNEEKRGAENRESFHTRRSPLFLVKCVLTFS